MIKTIFKYFTNKTCEDYYKNNHTKYLHCVIDKKENVLNYLHININPIHNNIYDYYYNIDKLVNHDYNQKFTTHVPNKNINNVNFKLILIKDGVIDLNVNEIFYETLSKTITLIVIYNNLKRKKYNPTYDYNSKILYLYIINIVNMCKSIFDKGDL